jgi:GT2 family glycosyltransferase/phosphatidylglycerophosphate synthase
MEAVAVDVFVLNYNGRALLDECLPSIVRAAAASRHVCRVTVLDNDSTDDSVRHLAERFPTVAVLRLPNHGLASFNTALQQSSCRVAVLLNNDVKAAEDAFDPLIEPLLAAAGREPIGFTAPRCFLFDGRTHEGLKTAVRWRYGLVQATALFDGAEAVAGEPGPTASAGAVLAVRRDTFLALAGFDSLYLPGRIEDLDFAFRAFAAGHQGRYVPTSVFYHRGAATFGAAFGRQGCDYLALRNTLLFQWRRLRHPRHIAGQALWLPIRALRDLAQAPFQTRAARFNFCRAALDAWTLLRRDHQQPTTADASREREFFTRHAPARLAEVGGTEAKPVRAWRDAEAARNVNYPISRWYLRPAACAVALRLAKLGVRPNAVTAVGLLLAVVAAVALWSWPGAGLAAAGLVLASWFCDRIDGPLARLQGRATPLGAWIDANVDELVEMGLHVTTAAVAARLSGSPQPWLWLIAFLVGKYLLMHGLASDEDVTAARTTTGGTDAPRRSLLHTLYHLPANADVRAHLLIVALATGWLTLELALVAVYYNFRWAARYVLLARRVRAASVARAMP